MAEGDCLSEYLAEPTRERFRVLVDETRRHVHLVACQWVKDPELAEEVTQEVFLRLASGRWTPKVACSGLTLLTRYTISVARTRLRSLLRRRARETVLDEVCHPAAPCDPSSLDDALDVRDAVAALPRELQQCVALRYFKGFGTQEIAVELGIPRRTVQDRLHRAEARLRHRLRPEASALLLPAAGKLLDPPPSLSPALEGKLRSLVARHPARIGGAPPTPTRAPSRAARLRRKALISAAASVLILGITGVLGTALLVRGRTSLGGGEAGPVVASTPEPPVPAARASEARARAGLGLFGAIRALAAALRRIDLPALAPPGKTGETAAVAERDGLCEITVVDEDGHLVRTGVLQVLRAVEAGSAAGIGPGESAETTGLMERLVSGSLADSNPAAFRILPHLLGSHVLVKVLPAGYPPVERSGIELGPGPTRVTITLPSRRAAAVRLRDAMTGEPARGGRVRIVPARQEDGRRRTGDAIPSWEEEPGLHVLRGLDGGLYDLSVSSPSLVPVLKEDLELGEETVVWVHEAERKRAGTMVVSVYKLDGSPWIGIDVTARVDGAVLTRKTDEKGLCRFEDLPEGSHAFLLPAAAVPRSSASFIAERSILVRPGRERLITLGAPLDSETLAVEVVDPRGAPLSGVVVHMEGTRPFVARTGEDGRAVFEAIPVGGYLGSFARTEGRDWVLDEQVHVRAGERNELKVTLGTGTVRGRVISAVPAGLQVLASRADRVAVCAVQEDGAFEFPDVPPGKIVISTAGDQRGFLFRRAVTLDVPEAGDPKEVEIRLEGLGLLWVEAAGADGRPVPGTRATCAGPGGESSLARRSRGARAAEFAGLVLPGLRRVVVTAPGREPVERRVLVEPGEEKTESFVLHGGPSRG